MIQQTWDPSVDVDLHMCRVGQNHTYTDIRYIYGILGREIIKYTVIYGVYIRFWPTLHMCKHTHYSIQTQSLRHMCKCTHPYTPSHSQSPKLYSQSLRTCSTGIPDHYSHLPHGCSRCLVTQASSYSCIHIHSYTLTYTDTQSLKPQVTRANTYTLTLLHTQTPSHSSLKLLVHTHTLLHSYIHRHLVTQASSYIQQATPTHRAGGTYFTPLPFRLHVQKHIHKCTHTHVLT